MQLKLEELTYQQDAIQSVVDIFDGTARNTFDNATDNGIRSNRLIISPEEIGENIRKIYAGNGITDESAKFDCPAAKEDSVIRITGPGNFTIDGWPENEIIHSIEVLSSHLKP